MPLPRMTRLQVARTAHRHPAAQLLRADRPARWIGPPQRGSRARSKGSLGLNVLLKVVQDGLPATPLLLDGMGWLRVERLPDRDIMMVGQELDDECPPAKFALDPLMLDDPRVRSGKIKTHAAVFGFHPR